MLILRWARGGRGWRRYRGWARGLLGFEEDIGMEWIKWMFRTTRGEGRSRGGMSEEMVENVMKKGFWDG